MQNNAHLNARCTALLFGFTSLSATPPLFVRCMAAMALTLNYCAYGSIHKLRQAKIGLLDPLLVSRLGEVSPIDNTLASSAPRPPPLPNY